uniref:Uncharacterized protein n=1 Tax=Pyxicephalus adspersus TaxID=30357 RepID=A0AAV3AJM9_PYXAD|nr:TPA: hypothetical protein GDO54_011460 [Pyxicephalus adspersus]
MDCSICNGIYYTPEQFYPAQQILAPMKGNFCVTPEAFGGGTNCGLVFTAWQFPYFSWYFQGPIMALLETKTSHVMKTHIHFGVYHPNHCIELNDPSF